MAGEGQDGRIIQSELCRLAGEGVHNCFGVGDVTDTEGVAEFVGQGMDKF